MIQEQLAVPRHISEYGTLYSKPVDTVGTTVPTKPGRIWQPYTHRPLLLSVVGLGRINRGCLTCTLFSSVEQYAHKCMGGNGNLIQLLVEGLVIFLNTHGQKKIVSL